MSHTSKHAAALPEEAQRELEYLRRTTERTMAKVLALDAQSMGLRMQFEQKRRGFQLMAELAVTLGQDTNYGRVFESVSRRINAALNMQRTVVLTPDEAGAFQAAILQGYGDDVPVGLAGSRVPVPVEMLNPNAPVLVTAADSPELFAEFRRVLALPYLVSSPVILNNTVMGILVTGRMAEQHPFLPRLGQGDVETVQTVSAYLAAMLASSRFAEAEERTRIMFDATPLCCTFWDEEGNNVDCNQEAVRMFGVKDKEEFLDRFVELSPEYQPDGSRSAEGFKRCTSIAVERGSYRFEWLHQTLSGEPMPTEVTLVRSRRGDKDIVAGFTRDLREHKAMLAEMYKTEEELRRARDLAERNAKAKSVFLANMSHEIRTPMNAILGMIHLLNDTELTYKQKQYVEQAKDSTNLLLRIINDILDFSKIDAGRLEMESIDFSTEKAVHHVRDLISEQVASRGLYLNMHIAPDVPARVQGDPVRLEQILLNLVNNAVKFTSQGGVTVQVSRCPAEDSLRPGKVKLYFSIADTGIGMTPEQMDGLFTPFTQADASTTRKYGGTGLGLAISRSLVDLMDGEISCESVPGKGSTFWFTVTLGLAEEARPAGRDGADAVDGAGFDEPGGAPGDFSDISGMRVLLAEDNEINQIIAVELLSSKGVEVVVAGNGQEALDTLDKDAGFDLVLMDIQMPVMDGLTAASKLRKMPRFKNLPVIAMTAHAMSGDRETSLLSGMNDHITKPIEPDLLYATLRKWR